MLNPNMDLDLRDVTNHEFIRSFGEIKQRERPHEVNESIFASANNAFSFESTNSFVFGSNKRFVPFLLFKRLFTNGINSRVDIGIENDLSTYYSDSDIDSIIEVLYSSRIFVPRHDKSGTFYIKIDMANLGNWVSKLYLSSTTSLPKEHSIDLRKDWIVSGNTMVLCHMKTTDTINFNYDEYKQIKIENLTEYGIELYYKTKRNIVSGYNVPVWLIVEKDNARKDCVRNLRIYLMKLHQERECFRQILRLFSNELFKSENFGGNIALSRYVKDYIYCSLLKKGRYGYNNKLMNEAINSIDVIINQNQIDSLLRKFDTETLKKIEEGLDKTMKKQNIQIKDSKLINSQVGSYESEMKIEIEGDMVIDSTISNAEFNDQLLHAIEKITEISELQQAQKDYLVGVLQEAREANTNNDEGAKKSAKDKFKAFLAGAGNVADKVVSAVANFASIAAFFGITPFTP
ncbi:hypothetical protein LJB90_02250 [Eubacteriales bacterium OttesenSCG-928-G02]|nr:hypothetical protein [Eubacteriales bacterium OttesenSCG-928-G02]